MVLNDWTFRAGLFDLSTCRIACTWSRDSTSFKPIWNSSIAMQSTIEPGRVLVTVFESHGRMGLLDEAVHSRRVPDLPVDIAAVRRYRTRSGISLSGEQEIDRGPWRIRSRRRGRRNVEAYEFTDIDRTFAVGLSLHGSRWHRAADTVAAGSGQQRHFRRARKLS